MFTEFPQRRCKNSVCQSRISVVFNSGAQNRVTVDGPLKGCRVSSQNPEKHIVFVGSDHRPLGQYVVLDIRYCAY